MDKGILRDVAGTGWKDTGTPAGFSGQASANRPLDPPSHTSGLVSHFAPRRPASVPNGNLAGDIAPAPMSSFRGNRGALNIPGRARLHAHKRDQGESRHGVRDRLHGRRDAVRGGWVREGVWDAGNRKCPSLHHGMAFKGGAAVP